MDNAFVTIAIDRNCM